MFHTNNFFRKLGIYLCADSWIDSYLMFVKAIIQIITGLIVICTFTLIRPSWVEDWLKYAIRTKFKIKK